MKHYYTQITTDKVDASINADHPWTTRHNEYPWNFTGHDRCAISVLFGAIETLSAWDGAALPLYFL